MTTAQRNAISSPVVSTMVYDTNLAEFYMYTSTGWTPLVAKASSKIHRIFTTSGGGSIYIGVDISWDATEGQGTALSYSGATVTLPANKTFMIMGAISNGFSFSQPKWYQYNIVNSSNDFTGFSLVSKGQTRVLGTTFGDIDQGTYSVAFITTGSTSFDIKLRVTGSSGGSSPSLDCVLIVQEL